MLVDVIHDHEYVAQRLHSVEGQRVASEPTERLLAHRGVDALEVARKARVALWSALAIFVVLLAVPHPVEPACTGAAFQGRSRAPA